MGPTNEQCIVKQYEIIQQMILSRKTDVKLKEIYNQHLEKETVDNFKELFLHTRFIFCIECLILF